jgi:hypothetical protein
VRSELLFKHNKDNLTIHFFLLSNRTINKSVRHSKYTVRVFLLSNLSISILSQDFFFPPLSIIIKSFLGFVEEL